MLAAALLGSIAPDLDVALGLLGGWEGAGAHRGATHSFLGAVVLASMIAVVLRGNRRAVFLAALGGILTHIFWDWLNPWGVRPFWPWDVSFRANLLHEGDLYATAILAVAALLMWRGRRRAAAVVLATLLPAYLLVQLLWREHARELAKIELAGRRALVYPARELCCGWIVLSGGESDMSVDCVMSPIASHLRRSYDVAPADGSFVRASERSHLVREFREKIPFPFAEVHPAAAGGAEVVWRDLRLAYRERPSDVPSGLHVRLDSAGRIVSERHHWWLTVW